MRRDLIRRLERIEGSFPSPPVWPSILLVAHRLDEQRKNSMAQGERVVLDWYMCQMPEIGYFWARERIATVASDTGRVCKPGQCLEDVLQELGQQCSRQPNGECSYCAPGRYPDSIQWPEGFQLG